MADKTSLITDFQKVRIDYERELKELRADKRKTLEEKSRLDAEEIEVLLKIKRLDADISELIKEDM